MKSLLGISISLALVICAIATAKGQTPDPSQIQLASWTFPTPLSVNRLDPSIRPARVMASVSPVPQMVSATLPTTRLSAVIPTEAGHHRLRFYTSFNDKPLDMCVVISNSKLIAATQGRVPTMLFLGGLGDRGSNGDGVFRNGPPAEMMRRTVLGDSMPMMIVSPQSPSSPIRWETPGMDVVVFHLLEILANDPRVDPDRIYLSGFSSGGKGAWEVATLGAKYFAAIAPIAAMSYVPEKSIPAVKDLPIWIICGDKDTRFTAGSLEMNSLLQKAGADVTLSLLPGVAHSSWEVIYPKPEFYEWFMAHARGRPATRPYSQEQLDQIARAPVVDPVGSKIKNDFATFAPYWQIRNCSTLGTPGLQAEALGRKNVFTAIPLNPRAPCILETTWAIPVDKHATLHVEAGHDPNTDWNLAIQVDGHRMTTTPMDATTAKDGWYEANVDLSQWAGKSVHLDLIVSAGAPWPAPAYFSKVEVRME